MVEHTAVNGGVEGSNPSLRASEIPLIDKDEYYFAIDEYRMDSAVLVFVHLTVHEWTLSVFKEILRNWKLFRECVTCPVFAVGGVEDTDVEKWERFVTLLGFQFHMNIVCENGFERRLFIHTNKKNNERFIATEYVPVSKR